MSIKANPQIERKTMMFWNGDGLADVVLGFGICAAGILMLLGFSNAMIAAWIPAMLLKWLKDRISVPRMGYVTFRPSTLSSNNCRFLFALQPFFCVTDSFT